jgi:hypothetical protein
LNSVSPCNYLISGIATANNVLGANVTVNATTYTDGPSMAQGTTGTWWACGHVTFKDTTQAVNVQVKLWDGTTAGTLASDYVPTIGAGIRARSTLCETFSGPAGNIRSRQYQAKPLLQHFFGTIPETEKTVRSTAIGFSDPTFSFCR